MSDISQDYIFLSRHAAGLCAFVLVARHGQLSAAARELRISQPGLSQRLKSLEESLDVTLFERTWRGVRLTAEGADLLAAVDPLIGNLAADFRRFAHRNRTPSVLVSVDFAFASLWLLPRLARLREAVRPVDLSMLTSQQPELAGGLSVDLTVRMAEAGDIEAGETKLMDERVSAVCSPDFLARHPGLSEPADLVGLSLLSLQTPVTSHWHDWESWFAHFGVTDRPGRERTHFTSYDIVVRAAQAGLGVALGWHGLIDDMLARGDLVPALPHVATSNRGYYIQAIQDAPSAAARRVHDWILGEALQPSEEGA
ncbi:LysR substrate-binding domain-containing protein [Stappia indica]|uniref:LysR substrate-binding domain-containing protein n=1 Tax=Stappia indica TaxID=538381 RepID=UPI000835BEDC|nr:LysR substrate-binding domain-containing protein [Stappia indica]